MNGLKNVRNRRQDALAQVGWERLETMLANYYRGHGWQVEHVGTGSGRHRFDGGVDLKLRKGDELVLLQCKHWNAKQVTHNVVHELLGIKVNQNATGAIVVTSGEFTRAAQQAALRQGHVQLIDGDGLRAMLVDQIDRMAVAVPPPPRPMSVSDRARRTTIPRKVAAAAVLLVMSALFLQGVRHLSRFLVAKPATQAASEGNAAAERVPSEPTLSGGVVAESEASRGRQPVAEATDSQLRGQLHTPVEPRLQIEPGMQGAELEEWQRKNAESMRILEENERRESGSAES